MRKRMMLFPFLLLASTCGAGIICFALTAQAVVTVTIDPSVEYQTILGWGASSWRPPWVTPALTEEVINEAVNDLGLTRLRLEGPSGNPAPRRDDRRWEWLHDNGDPQDINWAAFNTAKLDERVSKMVIPFKQRVEANGDAFNCYVSASFFDGGSSGSVPAWLLHNPGEYAEFATIQGSVRYVRIHLQDFLKDMASLSLQGRTAIRDPLGFRSGEQSS